MSSEMLTIHVGGQGGGSFAAQYPTTVGINGGAVIDAIVLNGTRHGGSGGGIGTQKTINDPTYWMAFEANTGHASNGDTVVTYLKFVASDGNGISSGDINNSDGNPVRIGSCRVFNISGASGTYLDQLYVELATEYGPSTLVETGAPAVLGIIPQGETYDTFEDSQSNTTQCYTYSTQWMQSATVNASAQGEYYAQFSASTTLSASKTTTASISTSCSNFLENSTTTTLTVAAGNTAFLMGAIDIMQDSSGNFWVYPNTSLSANWVVLDSSSYSNLIGDYTLASGVSDQTGLEVVKVNGVYKITGQS